MSKTNAIILASGTGSRFQQDIPKQFTKLAGLPILAHTLKPFQACREIDGIIIVTVEEFYEQAWELGRQYGINKLKKVVVGGSTRQESSRIGLDSCPEGTEFVLIHDGVRPFISSSVLSQLIEAMKKYDAVDTVIPSADTIVAIDREGFIDHIPDRSVLRRGQTPQAFRLELLKKAHRHALSLGISNATDDCGLVLNLGHKVFTVAGEEENLKITYPLDLHIADKLFQLRTESLQHRGINSEILSNKVFMIIGGTEGIGASLASQLLHYSKHVYPFSRRSDLPCDITDAASINAALRMVMEKAGRIDYIINCAGDLIRRSVEDMDPDEWRHIYDTNIFGNFLLAKAAIPLFKTLKSGSLMFIGSSSYTRGRGGYAAYSSSKAALVNFVQALSEEVSAYGIQVNLVSPGRVNTPLRYRNFGKENPASLLDPDRVAETIIKAMTVETTGSIFEIPN
jgi:2-C-methyl-D-erythritol 4-phosphate cytidylyltransferase